MQRKMEEDTVKKKLLKLREEIKKHNENYYVKNESLISDYEYDGLLEELKELEIEYPEYKEENSPSKKVGSSLKDTKFQKIEHKYPMLSLSNSYNDGDIIDFTERVGKKIENREKIKYCLEVKLDGLSISLSYKKGKLLRAVTRGDGYIGEDVTENILQIESIKKDLNREIDIEIRGEVVLPLEKFRELNEKRLENGEEIFANPRNVASGTLRQLDSKVVRERGLDAYFYFLAEAENMGLKSHSESMKFLEELGIKTTGIFEILSNTDEIKERINFWEKEKEKLDYETDGLVIKVDDIELWDEIGYTSKSPRWAIAYKFPAHQVTTILKDITWQVGRTGKLTPVAELEEVELSGSKVKRASLHNISEIKRKDIRVGDKVFIEKAAEIIPQVVKAIKELRTGEEKKVTEPSNCPVCNYKLEREEGSVDIKCINEYCPSKVQAEIEYFISRDALNIIGMGSKIVEKFLALSYITDITDIYNLKNYKEEIKTLEKMGEKSVEKLLKSIEESKKKSYDKLIYSLGIPLVGKVASKILAKTSLNIENLMMMKEEELKEIDGIGEIAAKEIVNFLSKESNVQKIKKLKNYGLKFEMKEKEESKEKNIFLGKTFLFTGSLNNYTREEIKEEIEKFGGKNLSSVSKNLDYLIIGEKVGSKLKKAEKIKTIKIITEDEFIEMVAKLTK